MFDLIKKTLMMGVGLALKTKDEVEDLADEIVKKGKMTEKEGKKFLDDLNERYEEAREKLEKRVEDAVKKAIRKANIVTTEELRALKKEIRELKKAVTEKTDAAE